MDPASAIGLASSIVQLLGFAGDLLNKSKEIYKSVDGSTNANNQLEVIARTLEQLTAEITIIEQTQDDVSGMGFGISRKDKSEKELERLCEACRGVSRELLQALEKLKRAKGDTKWGSFNQALRIIWSESKVNELAAQVEQYRRQIDTALLINLRTRMTRADRRSSATPRLTDAQLLGSSEKHLSSETLVESTYKYQWRPDHQNDLQSFSSMLSKLSEKRRSKFLTRQIIASLGFTEMEDRYERISEAYEKTFNWMFQTSSGLDGCSPSGEALTKANSFVDWLHSSGTLYWITGKPGSGKSTLMKYLYDHPELRENLISWYPDLNLVVAGFFFWNSGTEPQHSQIGLLRSLCHQILSAHPELLPASFARRWEAYQFFGGDSVPLSWTELSSALKNMLGDKRKRFLLFVDGLDELTGDHSELVFLLLSLASSENVKLCVASRPWLVFEEAFGSMPWLRLESLTFDDICFFVNNKMETSAMFQRMRAVRPESADALVQQITQRASGVFLWVRIVVQSLLEGLRDGDTFEELQARLEGIPTDIEDLFWNILRRLDPLYFTQACEIFQMHRASVRPLTLLDLAMAREGLQKALAAPVRRFPSSELEFHVENMRRFLNSRCKGLLEAPPLAPNSTDGQIAFLHRTVRDFFLKKEVWEYIQQGASDDFDPIISLSAAALARTKSVPPEAQLYRLNSFWKQFFVSIHYARHLRDDGLYRTYLDNLDQASAQFWATPIEARNMNRSLLHAMVMDALPQSTLLEPMWSSFDVSKPDSVFWANTRLYTTEVEPSWIGDPSTRDVYPHPVNSFFELAVLLRLPQYVIARLDDDIPITYSMGGHSLLEVSRMIEDYKLADLLIARKCPGSNPSPEKANDEGRGDKSKVVSPRWYKRLSKSFSRSKKTVQ